MKTETYILSIFILFCVKIEAQISIDGLSYENSSILNRLEMNPYEYEKILISDEFESILNTEELDEKNPILLFFKAIYFLKTEDEEQAEIWLDRILEISTDSICNFENGTSNKLNCAYFIRNLKAFILKYRILELFEEEQSEDYCQIFHEYEIDIEAEKAIFIGKLIGSGCVEQSKNPIFWDAGYYFLLARFLEYDCMGEDDNRNLSFFRGAITNNINQFPERERIQDLVTARIQEYLLETGNYGNTRKEMRRIIRDFRLNAELVKNSWYIYETDIFGVPIDLGTKAMLVGEIEWTNKEARRIERNKPIKRKGEIIREFKRTKYYRLFMERKL